MGSEPEGDVFASIQRTRGSKISGIRCCHVREMAFSLLDTFENVNGRHPRLDTKLLGTNLSLKNGVPGETIYKECQPKSATETRC